MTENKLTLYDKRKDWTLGTGKQMCYFEEDVCKHLLELIERFCGNEITNGCGSCYQCKIIKEIFGEKLTSDSVPEKAVQKLTGEKA